MPLAESSQNRELEGGCSCRLLSSPSLPQRNLPGGKNDPTAPFLPCPAILQAENSALAQANENQRETYERCLDEVGGVCSGAGTEEGWGSTARLPHAEAASADSSALGLSVRRLPTTWYRHC